MTIAIPVMALIISGFAWVVKDFTAKMLFHSLGIITWLVSAFLMYNVTYTNNTYVPQALFLVGIIGCLVEIVGLISTAIGNQKKGKLSYDEDKAQITQRIVKLTAKRKKKWWE